MKGKNIRRYRGRSYRSTDAKQQILRKEAQKKAKHPINLANYYVPYIRPSRQRGA
ncbi:MAG: hypothetical protein PHY23_01000 [Oscillospiraceae bacterium]|nr:hypothetical protein [Oscillospiraceae bacterium]